MKRSDTEEKERQMSSTVKARIEDKMKDTITQQQNLDSHIDNGATGSKINVKVEYFGPAKTFTNGVDAETMSVDTTHLCTVFEHIFEQYGESFVSYIIQSCGIVVNLDYIELQTRVLPLPLTTSNYKSILSQLFDQSVENNDTVVIVPPVSSG